MIGTFYFKRNDKADSDFAADNNNKNNNNNNDNESECSELKTDMRIEDDSDSDFELPEYENDRGPAQQRPMTRAQALRQKQDRLQRNRSENENENEIIIDNENDNNTNNISGISNVSEILNQNNVLNESIVMGEQKNDAVDSSFEVSDDGRDSDDEIQFFICSMDVCTDSCWITCDTCKQHKCRHHTQLEIRKACPELSHIVITDDQVANIQNKNYVCLECLNRIGQSMSIFTDYVTKFQRYLYLNNDGYINLEEFAQTTDGLFRMLSVDKMIDDYREINYNNETWKKMMFSADYMSVDGEKFVQYIHKWRDKCCNTQFANLISPSDECIIRDILIFKRFIMGKIAEKGEIIKKVDEKQNLIKYSKDDRLKYTKNLSKYATFRKDLWLQIESELKEIHNGRIRILYKIEQSYLYLEPIVEQLISKYGRVFDKMGAKSGSEKTKDSMLLNAMLPDEYTQRAYIVNRVANLRKQFTRYTGMYKNKYYVKGKKFAKLKGKPNRFRDKYVSGENNSLFDNDEQSESNFELE